RAISGKSGHSAHLCEILHGNARSSIVPMKAIVWLGASKDGLIGFPVDARRDAGYQLHRVQRGEEPSDWKPMIAVGPGVREIRIWDESGTFRVVYLATRPEALYVPHSFQKKTAKTSRRGVELARRLLKSILEARSVR